MRILGMTRFDGPGPHAIKPVFTVSLDMGSESAALASGKAGAFLSDIRALLPEELFTRMQAIKPWPEKIDDGGEGEFLAHIFCQLTLALQQLEDTPVRPYYHFRRDGASRWRICVVFLDSAIAETAIKCAARILMFLVNGLDPEVREKAHDNLDRQLKQFQIYFDRYGLGHHNLAFITLAQKRDIPWHRASEQENFIIFGHGCLQSQMQVSSSGSTSMTAAAISNNKKVVNQMLRETGFPVPRQHIVFRPEQAEQALKIVGSPVVVKPVATDHGIGISVNLTTVEQVSAAIELAKEFCPQIIVEKYIEGDDHRILVVGGKFLAAARRIPAMVQGDGRHSIAQLVDMANKDPRRGVDHEKIMTRIKLDDEADRVIAEQGFERASILKIDEAVYLKGTANLSTGGRSVDVSGIIHPDNVRMAERAVKLIGLNISGLDFITTDISQSYKSNGGAICEINYSPGLRPHILANPEQDVLNPVMDQIVAPGSNGRIPLAAITGSNGKTTTGWMLERIFATMGKVVGLANTHGVKIGGDQIVNQDLSGKIGAEMILRDRTTEIAIAEVARQGLLKWGLGFDKCNVSALLNVDNEHLGQFGIDSKEQMAELKGLLAEVTEDFLVLNAEDPLCLAQQSRSPAKRVCLVSMDPENQAFKQHVGAEGIGVTLTGQKTGEMITIIDGARSISVIDPARIPATQSGRVRFNIQNSLFAIAMAYGMKVPVADMVAGLESFSCTPDHTPGRQNIYENLPFTAISDYAHNPTELSALNEFLGCLEVKGSRILAFTSSGGRRDGQITDLAAVAAKAGFDHFICYEKEKLHDRTRGDVSALLRQSLVDCGIDKQDISVIVDEQEAVRYGAQMAKADDLFVLCFTDYVRTEGILTSFND